MLKILIKDLKLFGYHGVREKEKKNGQDFLFNIKVLLNKDDFTGEDDLEKTLSYSEIIKLVKKINESRRFDLLETLSQVLAEEILKFSQLAEIVKIKVEKISPPIKEDLYSVGVVYELKRIEKEHYIQFIANAAEDNWKKKIDDSSISKILFILTTFG